MGVQYFFKYKLNYGTCCRMHVIPQASLVGGNMVAFKCVSVTVHITHLRSILVLLRHEITLWNSKQSVWDGDTTVMEIHVNRDYQEKCQWFHCTKCLFNCEKIMFGIENTFFTEAGCIVQQINCFCNWCIRHKLEFLWCNSFIETILFKILIL